MCAERGQHFIREGRPALRIAETPNLNPRPAGSARRPSSRRSTDEFPDERTRRLTLGDICQEAGCRARGRRRQRDTAADDGGGRRPGEADRPGNHAYGGVRCRLGRTQRQGRGLPEQPGQLHYDAAARGYRLPVVVRRRVVLALRGRVVCAVDLRGADLRGAPRAPAAWSGVTAVTAGCPCDGWPIPTSAQMMHGERGAADPQQQRPIDQARGPDHAESQRRRRRRMATAAEPVANSETVPGTPPITPLTAAPPTAPAAAVVASAVRVMTRAAPPMMFMSDLLTHSIYRLHCCR